MSTSIVTAGQATKMKKILRIDMEKKWTQLISLIFQMTTLYQR